MGECNAVDAVGAFILSIAALVVSLKSLFSCSNAWICFDGSVAFPLLQKMTIPTKVVPQLFA